MLLKLLPAGIAAILVALPLTAQSETVTEAPKTPEELLTEFRTSPDPAVRTSAFDRLVTLGDEMVTALKGDVNGILMKGEKAYADLLVPKIRAEHLYRLATLTDEQVRHIVRTRRFWKDYLLNGGGRENFRLGLR